MTSPIEEEQGYELEVAKFIPLGHAMNLYLEQKYEDNGEYAIHVRATAAYIEKHPILIENYRNLLIAGGRAMALDIVKGIEKHVHDRIVCLELLLDESYEEANKKTDFIKNINREDLIDFIRATFKFSEDQDDELTSTIYNLTNYSGVAFEHAINEENQEKSYLYIYIFNF